MITNQSSDLIVINVAAYHIKSVGSLFRCFLFIFLIVFTSGPFDKVSHNGFKLLISLSIVHERLVDVLKPLLAGPFRDELLCEPLRLVQFHHNGGEELLIIIVAFINLQKQVLNVQQSFKLNIIHYQPIL